MLNIRFLSFPHHFMVFQKCCQSADFSFFFLQFHSFFPSSYVSCFLFFSILDILLCALFSFYVVLLPRFVMPQQVYSFSFITQPEVPPAPMQMRGARARWALSARCLPFPSRLRRCFTRYFSAFSRGRDYFAPIATDMRRRSCLLLRCTFHLLRSVDFSRSLCAA